VNNPAVAAKSNKQLGLSLFHTYMAVLYRYGHWGVYTCVR